MKKELKDTDILQKLYDEGMIDFEGDEDDLIMQVPTNIIKTGKFVIDVYRKGYEQAEKDIIEKINNLENPYPEDVFPEIKSEEMSFMVDLIKEHSSISPDRFSAHLMRKARESCKEDIIKLIGDGE